MKQKDFFKSILDAEMYFRDGLTTEAEMLSALTTILLNRIESYGQELNEKEKHIEYERSILQNN